MRRSLPYFALCIILCSCASKKLTTSIQNLENENKTLRGDVAKLQDQVKNLSNDLLVVQSRVENHPTLPPVAVVVKPAEAPKQAPQKMYRQESFLGDDIHFTDDEPGLVPSGGAATSSNGQFKFTNKDLANLPPIQPSGKPYAAPTQTTAATSIAGPEKPKAGNFAETTLIADTSKADNKLSAEDSTIEASYSRAYKAFTDQNYNESINLMGAFLKQYPTHKYSDNAVFWMGESYFQLKNYEKANKEFETVINKYPNGNKVPDAMLRHGICQLRLSKPDRAKASFDQLIKKYPESVAAKRAKATIGEL